MIPIYFATVLLDQQRWSKDKIPALQISTYFDAIQKAGFQQCELWEYHFSKASDHEKEILKNSPLDISILNAYCGFSDQEEGHRDDVLMTAKHLGVEAIKFNVGGDFDLWQEYQKNFIHWRNQIPNNIKLLCECHPGTVLENPDKAYEFFQQAGMEQTGIILHPFLQFDQLSTWIKLFNQNIQHLHFQMRDDSDNSLFVAFDSKPHIVSQTLNVLNQFNYQGTASIEFSRGTRTKEDTPAFLLRQAQADLKYLRDQGY